MKTLIFVNIRPYKVERMIPVYTAKRMGYRVALLTDEDPGLDAEWIDDIILTDTYDMKAAVKTAVKYAAEHHISGVLTWTDKDVELVAKIAESLNLPAISSDAAKKSRNKYLMRDGLKAVSDLSPAYQQVRTMEDLIQAAESVGVPAVLKPVGASGSKGIFKIDKQSDLTGVYNTMIESTSPKDDKIYTYYPGEYIYEEYMDGPEVSVDGLVQNGKVYMTGVADNLVTDDYSLDYLEVFPSEKDQRTVNLIKSGTEKALKALGFDHCAFHLEGRITSNGFKIIEVAGRPGGGFLATHVFSNAADISYIEMVIKVAAGENIEDVWKDFDRYSKQSVCHYEVLAKASGKVRNLKGLDDVIEDENVIVIVPLRHIGDTIQLPPKSFESCYLATTVIKGENFEAVKRTIKRIEEKLDYEIE